MSDTKTRAEKKLSVIPKGHWRNFFYWPKGRLTHPMISRQLADWGMTVVDDFHFFGAGKHPSKEIAEQIALEESRLIDDPAEWTEAVFFPDP